MATNIEIESGHAIELQERMARRRRRQHIEQAAVTWILRAAALISILTTVGIVIILVAQSSGFFAEVSIWEFLLGTEWAPLFSPQKFGVLSLVSGTLLVALIAGIVSLTLGLGAAIFLSEYAPEKLRRVLKPILEVLAGIPTVVYGYFALTFVTPILQNIFGHDQVIVFNALSAGLVMGLMIMPMVSTLSEDAMVAVPRSLRDAAYALGATRFEVSTKVVIPAALSGIVASFILGVSRAIGETMIVKIAAGATPNLTLNPLESVQAMTAYIVQVSLGETPQGSLEYKTIFAVGLLLFVMTLGMNIVGRWVISRFRQQYE
ncbi:phosphate ABC transporter permease subunit PstC [Candidatus Lucifugimonas marina]|jgi:phosphate transport system permease protein|uniref:Phosphate transport system permease protein n=1 Tax=Candidatus Lucifugimonas marina TaxID=3038979 RepID=A0AAJ5ZIZ2_9CHLR|nr:phosphate ABC transporter permease subunit PstC [SAR202 cluster bacterium JH702]MDG0868413.1 phosphate ABC transporter permease subunit PstC [SAR202 cluster bacterium JH639]WFG35046.1 phosphate ABC transporter permease subunit PstC [SAR202 cluster bacterium JH545]WFG39003.1 phosphate ABC transporter permease subunit PstC [SAR202 cluster bacterium JH1073]